MACKVISSNDPNSKLKMTLNAIYDEFLKAYSNYSLDSKEYIRGMRLIFDWDGHLLCLGRRSESSRVPEANHARGTEVEKMACTWFGEICYCCSYTSLPRPALVVFITFCKPFFRALYSKCIVQNAAWRRRKEMEDSNLHANVMVMPPPLSASARVGTLCVCCT